MRADLRARLGRIRGNTASRDKTSSAEKSGVPVQPEVCTVDQLPTPGISESGGANAWDGWVEAGHKTLKREISLNVSSGVPSGYPSIPAAFQKSLGILIPDICRAGKIPLPGELLFFDLETTGLSGGAGTLAFLAAFGRFSPPSSLALMQYLLLDYPGEGDFIEMAAKEFSSSCPPFVVSYNGKSFDSQILKTRCLMNGIPYPEFHHADLLHPARRLWKRLLPDCSQATIEVSVLGLDRSGDVPGSLAPEIWFSFLRSGGNRELLAICDHNLRDIAGLAALFLALEKIAAEPMKSRIRFDEESLALYWRKALKKNPSFFGDAEKKTGERLLEAAARKGFPQAVFALAQDLFKKDNGQNGCSKQGRALLLKLAADVSADSSGSLKAAALKSLAIDAEWRLADPVLALEYTCSALAVPDITRGQKDELEKRQRRLLEKAGAPY